MIKRRNFLYRGVALIAAPWTAVLQSGCSRNHDSRAELGDKNTNKGIAVQIHYLEIVTPAVDASVALHSKIHNVSFSAADESLGGARTARLADGGTLGIRAPMRDTERPVVRAYFLVGDIEEAVAAAARAGAEIAMTPTEIPGHGRFAIIIQGGIESGLWQV